MTSVVEGSDAILQKLIDAFVFSVGKLPPACAPSARPTRPGVLTLYPSPAFDAVEPLALGEFGTLYVIGFALISIAAQLATTQIVTTWNLQQQNVAEDTLLFLLQKTTDLIRLMFSALTGRYIVALFQTAKHNSGYVLFIVVSGVVLLKMADHAMTKPLYEMKKSPQRRPSPAPAKESPENTRLLTLEQNYEQLIETVNSLNHTAKTWPET